MNHDGLLVNPRGLLWVVLPVALFVLAPVLCLFGRAFVDDTGRLTLAHLFGIAGDFRQLRLMAASLGIAGATSVASLLIGVPLAFLIHRTDMPGRRFFSKAFLVPLLIPCYIQALVWTRLPLPFLYTPAGAVFVFTLSFFPFVTLIAGSGLRSVDPHLEEAAILARGRRQAITRVTLPLIMPHIMAGAIIVFVFAVINFEVPDVLRISVYPVEIFIQFSAFYDEKTAVLLAAPLILLTLALVWVQMAYMKKRPYVAVGRGGPLPVLYPLGRFTKTGAGLAAMILTVSVAVPAGVLLHGAGGLAGYVRVWHGSRDAIFYSATVALASALIMTGLSFVVSFYLVRANGWRRTLLDYAVQTGLAVPSIVLGIGLIHVWNHPWTDVVYTSSWILIVAFVCAYTPFVVKVISAAVLQVHPDLEAAALLGTGSRIKTLARVTLPLCLPGIAAGFFTGFVLSLFNLGTALLVIPPGRGTLPVSIYNFLHYGAMDSVYAQSVILVSMAVACGLLVYSAYRFFTNNHNLEDHTRE